MLKKDVFIGLSHPRTENNMSENKAIRKTPKYFFASFSEETESALYLVDYTTKFKKVLIYVIGVD